MEKPMNIKKIPQTDSIQELAQFWDSNDITDFEDQLEEVQEQIFERETVVEIRLQATELAAVNKAAKMRGINYADLIQEWVLEKINTA